MQKIVPFDDIYSRFLKLVHYLSGGQGRHFLLTSPLVLSPVFRIYLKKYLRPPDESRAGRLLAVLKPVE